MTQTFTAGKRVSRAYILFFIILNCIVVFGLYYKLHQVRVLLLLLFAPAYVIYILFQKQVTAITVDDERLTINFIRFFKAQSERYHHGEIKTILEKQARLHNPPTDLRIIKKKTGQELFRIRSGVFPQADFAAIHNLISGNKI